jgi:hypothetical protein
MQFDEIAENKRNIEFLMRQAQIQQSVLDKNKQ